MYGISFNGKHSLHDFGVTMPPGKSIGFPDKNKIIVGVPFSNSVYDFSELYGSQTYGTRQLTYPFNIWDRTKERMNVKKTQIINWLMGGSGKQKLYDDTFPGYYFLAEVEGGSAFSENHETGILTVTFTAYPFMIADQHEGNDIWDTFNFELDVAQVTEFDVSGSLEVILLNVGTPDTVPTITASNPMQITLDSVNYAINAGTTKSSDFVFKSGSNTITITGTGNISFEFYKELI